jgi:hypothetical protein
MNIGQCNSFGCLPISDSLVVRQRSGETSTKLPSKPWTRSSRDSTTRGGCFARSRIRKGES